MAFLEVTGGAVRNGCNISIGHLKPALAVRLHHGADGGVACVGIEIIMMESDGLLFFFCGLCQLASVAAKPFPFWQRKGGELG
jgi:hypothetical protein